MKLADQWLYVLCCCGVLLCAPATLLAQQTAGDHTSGKVNAEAIAAGRSAIGVAPINVRYEGGVYGFSSEKLAGTLSFNDGEQHLVFRDQSARRSFTIPYTAVQAVYAEIRKRAPQDMSSMASIGMVMIPIVGPSLLGAQALKEALKKKQQYVTFQYRDPLTNQFTTTYFKLHNKQDVDPLLTGIETKAAMIRRGDACFRLRAPIRSGDEDEYDEPPVRPRGRWEEYGSPIRIPRW